MIVSLIEEILTLIFFTLYESIMVNFYKLKIKKGCSMLGMFQVSVLTLFKLLEQGGFTYWFEALAFMGNTLCYI